MKKRKLRKLKASDVFSGALGIWTPEGIIAFPSKKDCIELSAIYGKPVKGVKNEHL